MPNQTKQTRQTKPNQTKQIPNQTKQNKTKLITTDQNQNELNKTLKIYKIKKRTKRTIALPYPLCKRCGGGRMYNMSHIFAVPFYPLQLCIVRLNTMDPL